MALVMALVMVLIIGNGKVMEPGRRVTDGDSYAVHISVLVRCSKLPFWELHPSPPFHMHQVSLSLLLSLSRCLSTEGNAVVCRLASRVCYERRCRFHHNSRYFRRFERESTWQRPVPPARQTPLSATH